MQSSTYQHSSLFRLNAFPIAQPIMSKCWRFNKAWELSEMKKHSERRKHCTLAVVRRSQKLLPRRRPLPRGTGRPKFNQLEMVTTFPYRPSLVRIDARLHAISVARIWQYRNMIITIIITNRPTNTHTHPSTYIHTHRQDQLQYTMPQLASAQCN